MSDSEFYDFVKDKMQQAKERRIIDDISGIYDVRLKCFGECIWKGKIGYFDG